MGRRVTYKMVNQWIKESKFSQDQGIRLYGHSGYYYLLGAGNTTIADAATPKDLWEKFNLIRSSWYAGYKSCEYELSKGAGKNE